jgi:YesN/AraC family two-component response regulator
MKDTKFILLYDEAIILSGWKYSLESACNYVRNEVCGQGIEIGEDERSDVVVTDPIMPGMSGVELCRNINARYPNIETVLVSGSHDEIREHILDFLRARDRGESIA